MAAELGDVQFASVLRQRATRRRKSSLISRYCEVISVCFPDVPSGNPADMTRKV